MRAEHLHEAEHLEYSLRPGCGQAGGGAGSGMAKMPVHGEFSIKQQSVSEIGVSGELLIEKKWEPVKTNFPDNSI
jgi:hypothetical protein